MSASPTLRTRPRLPLALATAFALMTGAVLTGPGAQAWNLPATAGSASVPAPGTELATITHLDGADRSGAYSVTTTEIGGAPVVTGTGADGTDPAATGSAGNASPVYRSLASALNGSGTGTTANTSSAKLPRFAVSSVYDTAVAVSQRAFARGASTVYLTRADRLGDALAAGALTDGPVLFVPRTGTAPSNVIAEVRRLGASQVIALGGEGAVSRTVLTSAADGRSASRIGGADSYATAIAIAQRAFPRGATEVYLAGLRQGTSGIADSADAAAAGSLSRGPVLPVPSDGKVPPTITAAIARLSPGRVYALGGTGVVSSASLAAAAGTTPTGRLSGANRYATSAAIARHAFPGGARVAYLAAGTSLADAVAGGSLIDGPVLFVPPAGAAHAASAAVLSGTLDRLGVQRVGALSTASALPAAAVEAVVAKSAKVSLGALPEYPAASPSNGGQASPSPGADTGSAGSGTAPTATPSPTATAAAGTCDSLVRSFRPIPLPAPYTITCSDLIYNEPYVLGLTETQVNMSTEAVVFGRVTIKRGMTEHMTKVVIAHEIAHAYSYASLTRNQRAWFVAQLRQVDDQVTSYDFNDVSSGYDRMPAEQWARGQAACAGWADPFDRPAASCDLIEDTIASPR